MTTDNETPRKRRRRRRRPQGAPGAPVNGASQQGGAPPQNAAGGESAQRANDQRRGRRRRSRNRGKRSGEPAVEVSLTGQVPEGVESSPVSGVLFVKPNGSGALVSPSNSYILRQSDPLVPRSVIDRLHLQTGIRIDGVVRYTNNGPELIALEKIEGMTIEEYQNNRRPFSELISIDPNEQFKLETDGHRLSARVLDLLSPLGKGQRCLIVAPPKAGKTTLLKDIAHGIETNHPEVVLMVLLVDERPEEVTDMRRSVKGEVVASSSDESAENHITIAETVLERARRLVELKQDVVILCDSITRMSRAYNNEQRSSGRILSGGIDARTMEKPRRFFGSARNAEDWGSLTIIATALVDTGSRMDEVIFQEFKGTGNTEIVLDRGLFERRIFPAINIAQTGTRKEEKLLPAEILPKVHTLRRALAGTDPLTAMKMLLEKMQKFQSNEQFLKSF
jgi:transcription termination factor Rho